ncbi:MAG: APC family permease [Cyclobacteriaceae bacterium]
MDIQKENRPTLNKAVGSFGFFSLAVGSMIGVGWVTAMGSWLQQAGPIGAILAFIVGGGLMLLIGLCYAEVTSLLPVAGGEVAYAYKSFGVGKSFLIGWFLTFGYLSVSAFEAISVGKVVSFLIPNIDQWPLYSVAGDPVYGSHLLLAGGFTALITLINFRGVKDAAILQTWLTFIFIGCTLIFIVAAFFSGHLSNLTPAFAQPGFGSIKGILAVTVTIPFWFVGFDTIPQSAEEANESISYRKLGILIIISILAAISFYIVLILATSMLGNREAMFESDLATAEAFRIALDSPFLVNTILLAALIGLLTSWNGFFLAGSRVLFAMGRGKIMSKAFGKSHSKFKTPATAVLFSGIVTFSAAFLGRGAMLAFVNVGSFCIALAFAGVSLSFLKLRKTMKKERPFRTPGGKLTGYLAFLGGLAILLIMAIPVSPAALQWPLEWMILITFSLLGLIFWTASKKERNKVSEKERDYLILENFGEDE